MVGLIENGRLDEAELKCVELKVRLPEQIDWIERSAALHEARGDVEQAVERYRQWLDFVERHADEFDSDSADYYQERIDRLRTAR